jgi:hypothetical protein
VCNLSYSGIPDDNDDDVTAMKAAIAAMPSSKVNTLAAE